MPEGTMVKQSQVNDSARLQIQRYLSDFETFENSLNGHASSALHTVRKAAIARFAEIGFPTTHDEEWKYTDLSPLVNREFTPVLTYRADGINNKDIGRLPFGSARWSRLVFVNGHFSEEHSSYSALPKNIKAGNLALALQNEPEFLMRYLTRYARYDQNAFTALSTAFLFDGAYVVIPDGVALAEPIHLLFISTDLGTEFVSHPRSLILVGKNSQATIVETYVHSSYPESSDDGSTKKSYFTNVVTEIALGENSVLEHEKVQLEHDRAFHMAAIHVHQDRNSHYVSNSVSFGGALVRNNIFPVLDGEGAEATLNGLYVGTGDQLIDNHTTIDHVKAHCASHELYKGILGGKSRGVFNGKILVRKDAQKTDAKQTNKNLILSDLATIDTKPQLEIFANDVKCTHGATVGQLDDDAMFYLRARGIGEEKARDMLIYAFASDVIDRIRVESMHEELQKIVHDRLEGARSVRQ
jgi:Fe-S cluster assembly protein SufD